MPYVDGLVLPVPTRNLEACAVYGGFKVLVSA